MAKGPTAAQPPPAAPQPPMAPPPPPAFEGNPYASPSGSAGQLPPVPEVIQVAPGAPQAEDGKTTTEYQLAAIFNILDGAVVAAFVALAAAGIIHPDATVVAAVPVAGGAAAAWVTKNYITGRSLRKAGTQG